MNEAQVRTLEQVREVLAGTHSLEMRPVADEAGRYAWIEAVLKRFDYRCLKRADRGVLLTYLQRISGYSRAQVTRLVSRWVAGKRLVKQYRAPEHAFAKRYTSADVALLAEVDQVMNTMSGAATACVLRRQRDVHEDARFARLGSISVAHLYNLRNSAPYLAKRIIKNRTVPVTELMLAQFPFKLQGFHADNGREFVNGPVARMLNKLFIEFTRSRPRHSNDNGLAETKNGAVVRKMFGYSHIPQRHAARFNAFCSEHFNPFLNFHRPCLFSTDRADPKKPGRFKRIYRPQDAMTPLDKFASPPDAASFLREGVTLADLQAQAHVLTGLQAANILSASSTDQLDSPRPIFILSRLIPDLEKT